MTPETVRKAVELVIYGSALLWPIMVMLVVLKRQKKRPDRSASGEFAIGMIFEPAIVTAGFALDVSLFPSGEGGLAIFVMPWVGAAYGAIWMTGFLLVRWFVKLARE